MHAREIIRDAVAGLVTGLTTTSTRVFQSRTAPIQDSELPCLLVYHGDESVEYMTMNAPRIQQREIEVVVEGYAAATTDITETLDDIAEQVEKAIGATPALGINKTCSIALRAISFDIGAKGKEPTGTVTLSYTATYTTDEANPQTIL